MSHPESSRDHLLDLSPTTRKTVVTLGSETRKITLLVQGPSEGERRFGSRLQIWLQNRVQAQTLKGNPTSVSGPMLAVVWQES